MIRLTKKQLRVIIKEEAAKSQKRPVVVTRGMLRRMISEAFSPDASIEAFVDDVIMPHEGMEYGYPDIQAWTDEYVQQHGIQADEQDLDEIAGSIRTVLAERGAVWRQDF